jgi:hypothetical protein
MSLEIEVKTGSIGSEVTPHQEVPMVRLRAWIRRVQIFISSALAGSSFGRRR